MSLTKAFLIWSNEHRGWWKTNGHGYTKDRREAGRYSWDRAVNICVNANIHNGDFSTPNESMVPIDPIEIMAEERGLTP